MAAEASGGQESNAHLLEELKSLSQSLYQSHISKNRRTTSLALPRSSIPPISSSVDEPFAAAGNEEKLEKRPRSRRISLSPWHPRQKHDEENESKDRAKGQSQREISNFLEPKASTEKKGIWSWKPIRALTHIRMQKLSCLFSVEVVAVQGLPTSMNGLRLSVCVRKKETKDGAVHTMPSRVSQGAADFEETLFVKCHVYCNQGSGAQLKFDPRPFLIYVFAVDAAELDFGRSSVDLSRLILESTEKSAQGERVRQWDTSFNLVGKAKGGELVVKLGFQIMEKDGGTGIYNQLEGLKLGKTTSSTSSFARKQSKTSFSIPSPKLSSKAEIWTPSQKGKTPDFQGIDELNLDEPAPTTVTPTPPKFKEPESKLDDLDLPEFDVIDKGIEIQNVEETEEKKMDVVDKGVEIQNIQEVKEKSLDVKAEYKLESSEVVKEVVHDQFHLTRLTELDSIAQQIKALESLMGEEKLHRTNEDTQSQGLEADEETVTREFLQMLENEGTSELDEFRFDITPMKLEESKEKADAESKVLLPDLGKGLGCVVQTRNGGYLAAMNPLDVTMQKKETPKLAMQLSKPFVLTSHRTVTGFELFQRMAAIGLEELSSEVLALLSLEELVGKTAEQVAFEGVASAIINGRNKEGANSSAARTVAAVKMMANAMSTGRKERITTGIWNVKEDPLTADEALALSLQKIEAMSIDALKIQAEMAEEDAPFDVSPLSGSTFMKGDREHHQPLASAVPLEDWINRVQDIPSSEPEDEATITLAILVQLHDPLRRYEAVGGPMIALIQATQTGMESENKFKVGSLHVGGMKVQTGGKKNAWDTQRQRLTAMQWLVAYGLGKTGKKGKAALPKGHDLLWSISSRVMADMWLKPIRNPDVKFTK